MLILAQGPQTIMPGDYGLGLLCVAAVVLVGLVVAAIVATVVVIVVARRGSRGNSPKA